MKYRYSDNDEEYVTEEEINRALKVARPDISSLFCAFFAGLFCGIMGFIGCLYMYFSYRKQYEFDKAKAWKFGGVAGFVLQIIICFAYKIFLVGTAAANGNL